MILKSKHIGIIHSFLAIHTLWNLKRKFSKIVVKGTFTDRNLPVLVLANHFSWWDGIWIAYLNIKHLKRKFHFMMLEEQLRKYWVFKYIGGFSVQKNSRSILESLRYTTEILTDPGNMVFMFPQGRINSLYDGQFQFEKGVSWVLKHLKNEVQILFVVNLVDYFSSPKPSVFMNIQEFHPDDLELETIQESFQQFYNQCVAQQRLIED